MASSRRPLIYRWRDELAEAEGLTVTQRAVGWRASDYADAHGHDVRPGSLRLARECGLTVRDGDTENRVVLKALRVLTDRGFLEKVRDGHRGQATEYRLTLPAERWSLQTTNDTGKVVSGVPERWSPQTSHRPMTSEAPANEDIS